MQWELLFRLKCFPYPFLAHPLPSLNVQDLGDALEGASVTDMTWDAGGTDAVLGASTRDGDGDSGRGGGGGGGIWHLRLPQGAGGEPTLARLWPGGNLEA